MAHVVCIMNEIRNKILKLHGTNIIVLKYQSVIGHTRVLGMSNASNQRLTGFSMMDNIIIAPKSIIHYSH